MAMANAMIGTFIPMTLSAVSGGKALDQRTMAPYEPLSLGASPLTTFRRVTLPLSLPGMLVGVVLIFVPVIGSFMEPRILGGKDAIMLGPIIEGQFNAAFNWPLGAALSFTMLTIVLLIILAASPLLRRQLART